MAILPAEPVRLAGPASKRVPRTVLLAPEAEGRAALVAAFGLLGLRKLRFSGELRPVGRDGWELAATLGATVTQPCVITGAPVTTRIDEQVTRRYLSDLPPPPPGETEMPEDDSIEPLPAALDLAEVLEEALSLALPPWPRAEGAEFAEAEAAPLKAEDGPARETPFAALAALKGNMGGGGSA